MAATNFVVPLKLATFNSASLTGAYQVVDALGLPHSVFLLRIINNATTAVQISYNGIDDHDYIRPNSELQLSFQNNSQPNNFIANMRQGTKIYVKGTAGVGTIAVTGYFQPTQF